MAARTGGDVVQLVRTLAGADAPGLNDRDLLRRFAADSDQAAFAALVRRHGGMVLGVCRRALPSLQDAEDACQATFLVLAQKAKRNRWQPSVANWLYTTARKVARNARKTVQRRTRREARAAVPEAVPPVDRMTGAELLAALDEELDRLPPRYREPLVLCYLEGLTRDEAAARLGVPATTLKVQLERGRKRLGDALTKRGCALGAGLLALAATSPAGASPPCLVHAVLAAVSGPAPAAAALAKRVAVNAIVHKSLWVGLLTAGVGMLGVGVGSVALTAANPWPDSAVPAPAAAPAQQAAGAPAAHPETTVSGRVLSPDGQPLAGAQLLLHGPGDRAVDLGISGPDGLFTVRVPKDTSREHFLAARAGGAGLDFVRLCGLDPTRAVELRLVKDRVIRGRVVDTEGNAVVGARVALASVGVYPGHSVDPFLAERKTRMSQWGSAPGVNALYQGGGFLDAVTTGAGGRFTLAGTGAERVVSLRVSGAGRADTELYVVNREGFDPKPYNESANNQVPVIRSGPDHFVPLLHGPDPVIVVEAGKIIRGVVREADTGKPRPGAKVFLTRQGSHHLPLGYLSGTADAAGGYEIRGARKATPYELRVFGDRGEGLLDSRVTVPDTDGYQPVSADVTVGRVPQGAVVTGRVIDAATGRGTRGTVWVGIPFDNPIARAHPGHDYSAHVSTAEDGTFRIVTVPGPVLLMGGAAEEQTPPGDVVRSLKYKPATHDPKYPQYFPAEQPGTYLTVGGAFAPLQGNFCQVLRIEPSSAGVEQDIIVAPASTVTVNIQDAAGRPVTGAYVEGVSEMRMFDPVQTRTDSCVAYGVAESGKPRRLVFCEPSRKLIGTLVLKGGEKGPVVARLEPGGGVRGRLLNEDGEPLAGVELLVTYNDPQAWAMQSFLHRTKQIVTAADGTFSIDDLIPGMEFKLNRRPTKRDTEWQAILDKTLRVEPGRTLDLGEVKAMPAH
jgi:RNA polymerase sigma factor (sigma-70 family)